MAWYDELAAGGLSAVDEALFGIPEYIAKQVNRPAVENYIKQHQAAHDIGGAIGTIGSAFIPIPGLGVAGHVAEAAAKGGMELAKMGQIGGDIAKIGEIAKPLVEPVINAGKMGLDQLAKWLGTGALSGAAEAGVRGFTSEKTPEQIAQDIQMGGLMGGAGGAAGGWLSQNLGRIAGELGKSGKKAYISMAGINPRQAVGYMRDLAGEGAKGLGHQKVSDDALTNLFDFAKKYNLTKPGMDDIVFDPIRKNWGVLGKVAEDAFPNASAADMIAKVITPEKMQDMSARYGEQASSEALKAFMDTGSQVSGMAHVRSYLDDLVTQSFKETTSSKPYDAMLQNAQRDLARSAKTGIDNLIQDAAQAKGVPINIPEMKAEYLPARAFAESAARSDLGGGKINLGSPTLEKVAMAGISPLAGAGLGFASGGDDMETRIKNAVIGGVGGFGAKKLTEKGLTALLGNLGVPLAKLAEKVAPTLASHSGAIAGIAGGLTGAKIPNVLNPAKAQAMTTAAPEGEGQTEAASAGADAGTGDKQAYFGKVYDRMKQKFAYSGLPQDDASFKRYSSYIGSMTQGFDPKKVGALLYDDPVEREKYDTALLASTKLSQNLGTAIKWKPAGIEGILGGIGKKPEDAIAQEQAYRAIQSVLSEAAKTSQPGIGGTEKIAQGQLDAILRSNASQKDKRKMIENTLAGYGIDTSRIRDLGLI